MPKWMEKVHFSEREDPYMMWANESNNPDIKMKYGILKEKKKDWGLKPYDVLLGCSDPDYTVPVVLPWDGKSMRILIFGTPGSGKTQLATWLAQQFHFRYKYDVFIYDPKNDYTEIRKAMDKPHLAEISERFKFDSHGVKHAEYVTPKFLRNPFKLGHEYIIGMKDFEQIPDVSTQIRTLAAFFNVDLKVAEGRALRRVLNACNAKKSGFPNTTNAFLKLIEKDIKDMVSGKVNEFDAGAMVDEDKDEIDDDEERGAPVKMAKRKRIPSFGFRDKVVEAIQGGILGDKPAFDFAQGLRNSRFLIFQTSMQAEQEATLMTYVKLALMSIITAKMKYAVKKQGIMTKQILFIIDEAQTVVPKSARGYHPALKQLVGLVTEQRKSAITPIFITQDPMAINQTIINESNYIFVPKVDNESLISLLTKRGVTKEVIKELQSLEFESGKVKEWALCTPNSKELPLRFFPSPPLSRMAEEEKVEVHV